MHTTQHHPAPHTIQLNTLFEDKCRTAILMETQLDNRN